MAQSFSNTVRLLRGVPNAALATAKTKNRRLAVYPGIRNPRFAPSFTADLLLYRGAKHIKRRTAFEEVPNAELATAKNKRPPDGGLLFLVEHRGFEPLTPTLPVLCAPNCANAPYVRLGKRIWRALRDLNPRPTESESGTLSGLS